MYLSFLCIAVHMYWSPIEEMRCMFDVSHVVRQWSARSVHLMSGSIFLPYAHNHGGAIFRCRVLTSLVGLALDVVLSSLPSLTLVTVVGLLEKGVALPVFDPFSVV